MTETKKKQESKKEPVKAYLRLRPGVCSQPSYIEIIDEYTICMIPPNDSRSRNKAPENYTFTKIFEDTTDQKTLFDETTMDLVQDVMTGNNALLFAYGVTNSGKTYSVIGNDQDPGLIPRAIRLVFNSVQGCLSEVKVNMLRKRPIKEWETETILKIKPSMHSLVTPYENAEEENRYILGLCNNDQTLDIDHSFEYSFWVSFTEIYNEQIFDLLDPAKPKPGTRRNQLHLRCEPGTGYRYVHDTLLIKVKSIEETDALLQFGQQNRQVFSTAMNQGSSRSHSIFTLHVIRCPLDQDNFVIEDTQYTTLSKLSFVDLAGSERHRNTLSTGQRLKEAGNINKSLMVLGQCMELLRYQQKQEAGKSTVVIPYRQSKLTELFKASFEGNGKASIIVNANPFDTGFDENSHVMKFAAVTKEVTTIKQIKPAIDLKEAQAGLKRSREDMVNTDMQLDHDRLFMMDVIGQLELIEKRHRQIEDAEAVMRQQIDQQVRNRLFDLGVEEKEKIQSKLDDESTDKKMKPLLYSFLEKQNKIIKELEELKVRAKEAEIERQDLMDQIERLQKERKQQRIENSLENESEDESISTDSTPFDSLLFLRKELRKSIFKKDVLCEDTDSIMKRIEEFDGVTFNLAKETKMGKLLKVIASEKFEKDPYNIQNRAFRLFKKYAQLGTVNDNHKEALQSIPQSPSLTQASFHETGFDDNKDLQEENFKLRCQLRSVQDSHIKLKQVMERIIKQPKGPLVSEDTIDTASLVNDFPHRMRLDDDDDDDDDDINPDIFKQDKPLTKRRKLRTR